METQIRLRKLECAMQYYADCNYNDLKFITINFGSCCIAEIQTLKDHRNVTRNQNCLKFVPVREFPEPELATAPALCLSDSVSHAAAGFCMGFVGMGPTAVSEAKFIGVGAALLCDRPLPRMTPKIAACWAVPGWGAESRGVPAHGAWKNGFEGCTLRIG